METQLSIRPAQFVLASETVSDQTGRIESRTVAAIRKVLSKAFTAEAYSERFTQYFTQ
jgi:hypothetical protein